ncbi:MAG: FixH family protein [Rubellimicrobium sp.]|nr:FixH family protein [Rubellimicrobium sp.]
MTARKGEFTGRHMLAIMVAFFGVIIAVNVTMAVMAGRSWTGIVVEDTYIASQEFNANAAEGRAQAALGWTSALEVAGGVVTWRLTDRSGAPVWSDGVTAQFRHPAYDSADRAAVLVRGEDGSFSAPVDLPDGQWIIAIAAEVTALDHPYREARRVTIRDGAMQ